MLTIFYQIENLPKQNLKCNMTYRVISSNTYRTCCIKSLFSIFIVRHQFGEFWGQKVISIRHKLLSVLSTVYDGRIRGRFLLDDMYCMLLLQ